MGAQWSTLVAQVRQQVDADPADIQSWLVDRAQYLNSESSWGVRETTIVGVNGQRVYPLPVEADFIEALIVNGQPFQRSTLHQMDARWSGQTGNTGGIYADSPWPDADTEVFQVHPPITEGAQMTLRYVERIDLSTASPFPSEFDQALVDGAIAIGIGRMDERFDSAQYFEQRFLGAIPRLRRRRSGRAGRGAVAIRVGF